MPAEVNPRWCIKRCVGTSTSWNLNFLSPLLTLMPYSSVPIPFVCLRCQGKSVLLNHVICNVLLGGWYLVRNRSAAGFRYELMVSLAAHSLPLSSRKPHYWKSVGVQLVAATRIIVQLWFLPSVCMI